jgi:hypothetical protein
LSAMSAVPPENRGGSKRAWKLHFAEYLPVLV